jgi:hypothetical protein
VNSDRTLRRTPTITKFPRVIGITITTIITGTGTGGDVGGVVTGTTTTGDQSSGQAVAFREAGPDARSIPRDRRICKLNEGGFV